MERDKFLTAAYSTANLPLVQIAAKATYKVSDVSCALSQYISSEKVIGISKKETDVKPEKESTEKLCPKCSSELALKVAKKR